MITGKQLNKRRHGTRNRLPSGYSWKGLEDACYKVVVDIELYQKLANRIEPISLDKIHPGLHLEVDREIVKLAVIGLLRHKRLEDTGFKDFDNLRSKDALDREAKRQQELLAKQRARWEKRVQFLKPAQYPVCWA